jgi:hypothetical protein
MRCGSTAAKKFETITISLMAVVKKFDAAPEKGRSCESNPWDDMMV